jgi:hypothetical protein
MASSCSCTPVFTGASPESGLLRLSGASMTYGFVVTRAFKCATNNLTCTTFPPRSGRRHAPQDLFLLTGFVRLYSESTSGSAEGAPGGVACGAGSHRASDVKGR